MSELDSICRDLTAERRARGVGEQDSDLLGLLIAAGLDDDGIRDELVTMVVAGHETVASALTWTLMLLAENPAAQDRLREEVRALDAAPSPMRLRQELPWTRAVIDESLRLFPPGWVVSRRSTEPDVVAGQAGSGGHDRHHQPVAAAPRRRLVARPARLHAGAVPRRHVHRGPARLRAVRPRAAPVHRSRLRAGGAGGGAGRAAPRPRGHAAAGVAASRHQRVRHPASAWGPHACGCDRSEPGVRAGRAGGDPAGPATGADRPGTGQATAPAAATNASTQRRRPPRCAPPRAGRGSAPCPAAPRGRRTR